MHAYILQQIVLPRLRTLRTHRIAAQTGKAQSPAWRSIATSQPVFRAPSPSIESQFSAPSSSNSPRAASRHLHVPSWDPPRSDTLPPYDPPIDPRRYETGRDPPAAFRPVSSVSEGEKAVRRRASGASADVSGVQKSTSMVEFLRLLRTEESARRATLLLALERIAAIPVEGEAGARERRLRGTEKRRVKRRAKWQAEHSTPLEQEVSEREEADPDRLESTSLEGENGDSVLVTAALELDTSERLLISGSSASASTERGASTAPLSLAAERSPLVTRIEHPASRTVKVDDSPHFPPTIFKLLSSRMFRLAVFHLLRTPEYTCQPELLIRAIRHLEREGATREAARLRRRLEQLQGRLMGADGEAEADLGSNAAQITQPRRRKLEQEITAEYNAHLTRALFGSKYRSQSLASLALPLSPRFDMLNSPLRPPSAGYHQLRELLIRIERLRRHRGFRPDWVTANIVVRSWLECFFAARATREYGRRTGPGVRSQIRGKPPRVTTAQRTVFAPNGSRLEQPAGWAGMKVLEKLEKAAQGDMRRRMDLLELRSLFDFVVAQFEKEISLFAPESYGSVTSSDTMERPSLQKPPSTPGPCPPSPLATSPASSISTQAADSDDQHNTSLTKRPGSHDPPPSDSRNPTSNPRTFSYSHHIRPFVRTISRAMRDSGDTQGAERVYEWDKRAKARMYSALYPDVVALSRQQGSGGDSL